MMRPGFLAEPAVRAVLGALPGSRVVGGAVRDAVLGLPVADVDVASPWEPARVMAALRAAGLDVRPTGLAHGTVTAISAGRGFEVTTLRRDVATDGRHAVVAFTDDWRADAARRDFTMNALSLTPEGELFDYFGGVADAREGRVRFVGEAAARIAEDYLRVLRFFRFYARYGREAPDAPTRLALRAGRTGLARLSAERVRHELLGLLAAPDPRAAVALMAELGVLDAVLPGAVPARLFRLLDAGAPADPLLRLAALTAEDRAAEDRAAEDLAARLRLSVAEARRLAALREGPPAPEASDDDLRRALAGLDPRLAVGVLADRAWLADDGDPRWAGLRGRLAGLARPVFPVAGRDARALGVAAGPLVGVLLDAVRGWWLAGGCVADRAACRAELARRVGGEGG